MLDKYCRFSKVAGVSIEIQMNGNALAHICLLAISGNQLTIEKKMVKLTDINEIKKLLPEKTIVAINLTGKGILIKQSVTPFQNETDLSTIIPNAKTEDFYTQIFDSGKGSFVSLIRKAEADRWVIQLQELGLVPVALSLGPFVVNQIIPQLNVYGQELIFDRHVILRDEQNAWLSYKYVATATAVFPFKLENEQIDESLLLPYACAFQLALYPNITLTQTNAEILNKELLNRIDHNKLKVKGMAILIGLFTLLLINFLLFSYFTSSNMKLATQVGQSTILANNAASVADSVRMKKKLLEMIGWEHKINKSALIDQIAQLLPEELYWQQVSVDPSEVNQDHGVTQNTFAARQIRVTGTSVRLIPVNEWIARLKTKPWIKDVQLQSYNYNNELDTGEYVVVITY
ncbi:PilN domain-containing protein [Mucilaginibacter jinjuensis]|uniref:PilN domain-containing protein n=1 Tax=Mucilaginibacter jinjuensis TaxID=1176721 RepID=A0ABY7TBF1_9SPHI|nr:PilN domain-containing protein [Mucilaginibacter jinjuensis]WCT13661.1 PilN domain-containing protein [Mucilaginibacter jinjuensis]